MDRHTIPDHAACAVDVRQLVDCGKVFSGTVFSGTVFTGQLGSQVCALGAERGVASGHGVMAYRCTSMPTDQRDVVTRLWASEW